MFNMSLPLYVTNVEEHKTGMERFMKLVLEPVDHARTSQYLGDSLSPSRPMRRVSQLTDARVIHNLSSRLKVVGAKRGLSLASACRVRNIVRGDVLVRAGADFNQACTTV
jgi:hypothetical protein